MEKNHKIKNNIIIFFIIFISFIVILLSNNKNSEYDYYAELLKVTEINYKTNEVTFKNSNGFIYIYNKIDPDIFIGNYYNALMKKSGKENDVRDDIIVNIRYERPDLF